MQNIFTTLLSNTFFLMIGIFMLLWRILLPFSRKLNVTLFTYIGAIGYFIFFICILIGIRYIQLYTYLDLKQLPYLILNAFSSFHNTIFTIFIILLWVLIFIKIQNLLIYQAWKIYLYHKYKYSYNEKSDYYKLIWKLEDIKDHWSYHAFCIKIARTLKAFAKKLKIEKVISFCSNFLKFFTFFRYFFFSLLWICIIFDCYFHNFVLIYTKYYLFFYVIFILWYKLSLFFFYEKAPLDEVLYERTYCFPRIVYVNLTEEEENLLRKYIKAPYSIREELRRTWKNLSPDIKYYKRFVYKKIDLKTAYTMTDDGIKENIQEEYIYVNEYTGKCFLKRYLKGDNGRYYVDAEIKTEDEREEN